jgi:hypothetical protein
MTVPVWMLLRLAVYATRGDFVTHDKPLRWTHRIFLYLLKRTNMKAQHLVVIAFAAMAGAISAQAHEVDPGGKIEVACASDTVRMAAISGAVQNSHYWAPQTARRQMLSLAQQACARGATVVTFVPPADQRWCRTPPTWSTLCVDQTATAREAGDSSILPSSSARE